MLNLRPFWGAYRMKQRKPLFESKVVGIQKVQGKKKPQETLKTEKQQKPTSNFQEIVQDLRRKCSLLFSF